MSTYSQVKYNVEISGAWQQSLGALGAQGFTTECTYQIDTNDPANPSSGQYYGQGPNGEQVLLTIGWLESSYFAQIDYIFETVSGISAATFPLNEIAVGSSFVIQGMDGGITVGITTVLSNIERLTVPPMLEKSRMPLPADSLLRYAKAVHAANPAAAGLLANIQAAETAYRLTKSPSTRSAVTIQQSKTAMQLLRKNLQEGIPNKSMIGVNMPKPVSRAGVPAPKFSIGKWRDGMLNLRVQKERIEGKRWLAVEALPAPDEIEEGIYWRVTKSPLQLDGEELAGVAYLTDNVVYIRTRWEGIDRNGAWFGPWSPFRKYNIPKAGRQ
jgi:hypothetical protein